MMAVLPSAPCFSLPFYLMGAWPIVGFMGLECPGAHIAFRASFRSRAPMKNCHLTSLELLFARVSMRGARREMALQSLVGPLEASSMRSLARSASRLSARDAALRSGLFSDPTRKPNSPRNSRARWRRRAAVRNCPTKRLRTPHFRPKIHGDG